MAECLQNLSHHAIQRNLNRQPSKWVFNPTATLYSGGRWELMVRAAKIALQAVLGNQRLADCCSLDSLSLSVYCQVQ
jgi:hypothetical protein